MSEEDRTVWKILCSVCPHLASFVSKEDEMLDHISIFEFTTNYKRYSKSFARFRISAGEFFDCLHQANNKMNEVATDRPTLLDQ